ncbi:GroES-like protein [Coprinellus micaceus]|uniref:GroES-like protein n=1 Tax=Coprinellus micaceus TaxID=71717 RepID=A0A4Y7TWX0_COPMI|nr:GroES-like protein [Coprinellus micaceus]
MATYDLVAATAPGQLGVVQDTIPEPAEDQVVIRVEYSTLSPFDLYNLDRNFFVFKYPHVFGVTASGTIAKVGSSVPDLSVGDRVIALPFPPGNKGLQAYTLQSRSVVTKIPDSLPLEKAVTYPDNFTTAFFTLFNQLDLPIPDEWPAKDTPNSVRPILVYGAGSTSGQHTIQLLKYAGYTNVVAVASKKHEQFLETLGAAHVVDYNSPSFAEDVIMAAGGKVELVVDSISLPSTFALIKDEASMETDGELVQEAPKEIQDTFPENVSLIAVSTFFFQKDKRLADTLIPVFLPKLIGIGLQPNRVRLLNHADLLTRVKDGFDLLRQNKISGEKLVIKVGQ